MFIQIMTKGLVTCLIVISLSCGQQEEYVSGQVINEAKQSVFSVEAITCGKSSIGTGVLIDEGVLTNAHVVAGSEKLKLIDSDGNRTETYPIMIDFETDLALLKNPELPLIASDFNGRRIVDTDLLVQSTAVDDAGLRGRSDAQKAQRG